MGSAMAFHAFCPVCQINIEDSEYDDYNLEIHSEGSDDPEDFIGIEFPMCGNPECQEKLDTFLDPKRKIEQFGKSY